MYKVICSICLIATAMSNVYANTSMIAATIDSDIDIITETNSNENNNNSMSGFYVGVGVGNAMINYELDYS